MERYMDLHIHTFHSDGVYSPTDIVRMTMERGMKAIAISDHDSVAGVDEAMEAGKRFGVEVIPAVELSVSYKNYHDVHLLGYYIDHHDARFSEMLRNFREARSRRGKAIIEKINTRLANEHKPPISLDEASKAAKGALSRLHIARVMVDKGLVRNIQDAFTRYLQPCDVPKEYLAMEDAIAEVRRIHGVTVLAHPPSITEDRKTMTTLVGELAAMGLDGIEVFNNLCYKDDMIFFESLCEKLQLAMTGGSDFHGVEDDVQIGIGRGALSVAFHLLARLKLISDSRR